MLRSLALPRLKRKARNSWAAVQDTFFSTKVLSLTVDLVSVRGLGIGFRWNLHVALGF